MEAIQSLYAWLFFTQYNVLEWHPCCCMCQKCIPLPLWKAVWNFLRKLNMELPFDPAISLLGLYLKDPETPIQKNLCTPMFIAALFTVAKCWKQPKCPSANEWIKKLWHIYTMEYYTAEREKELLPFTTAWMELESITLCEVSQAVKDKYHMISPLSGTKSTKQTSEQNRTRDIEIKNKLSATRGTGEGDNGGKKGKGHLGTSIKDPQTKPMGGRIEGRKWRVWGEMVMGKWRQLYLNNNKKIKKNKV